VSWLAAFLNTLAALGLGLVACSLVVFAIGAVETRLRRRRMHADWTEGQP